MLVDAAKKILKRHYKFYLVVKHITWPYYAAIDWKDRLISQYWLAKQEKSWEQTEIKQDIKISLLVPVYNTPEKYLREMVSSVLRQTYGNWELILVDDCSPHSNIKKLLQEVAAQDSRIKTIFLKKNQRISAATNEALRRAKGKFVTLLDHDDLLHEKALEYVAHAIQQHSSAAIIYTDEAKIQDNGMIYQPFLKPSWNYELLRSINYITHMTTIRRDIIEKIGGEKSKYDGAQDWDLFIRATELVADSDIIHIPKVLYYWRIHQQSTADSLEAKPYVIQAQRDVLTDDVVRRREPASIVHDPYHHGQWYKSYKPITNPSILTCQLRSSSKATIYNTKAEYVILTESSGQKLSKKSIEKLIAEASRPDVGLVVPRLKQRQVIYNLKGILPPQTWSLLRRLSRRSVTKHVYRTTKYNVTELKAPVAVVEAKKLMEVIDNAITIQEISRRLHEVGYRNVYNPHITK